jgi:hypothetical protein
MQRQGSRRQPLEPALFDDAPEADQDGLGCVVARGKKKSLKESAA